MDHRAEYAARINRVLDYIETHLGEDLTLEQLARVACFSPFHFHRVFRGMMGEPLQRFIQRVRLERAAFQLCAKPRLSVTEIALDSGFASSATFARAFRKEFGMSATDWRKSKKGKPIRNQGKELASQVPYVVGHERSSKMTSALEVDVTVKDLPSERVAYVRHVGPYQGDTALFGRLFGRLATWAGPRGLLGAQAQFLALYHDNPEITHPDKLRLSVCLTIGDDVDVDGDLGQMRLPGGKYAVARFRIDADQYGAAWDALMGGWLPASGYQPDDRIPMERYLNDPATDPELKHELEICLPVKPL